MARVYTRWTVEEDAQLLHLRDVERKFFTEIDATLNKSRHSSGDRYKILARRRGDVPAKPPNKTSRTLLRDTIRVHEVARVTAGHASITAAFFGDPPPGRSALDQKRMAAP